MHANEMHARACAQRKARASVRVRLVSAAGRDPGDVIQTNALIQTYIHLCVCVCVRVCCVCVCVCVCVCACVGLCTRTRARARMTSAGSRPSLPPSRLGVGGDHAAPSEGTRPFGDCPLPPPPFLFFRRRTPRPPPPLLELSCPVCPSLCVCGRSALPARAPSVHTHTHRLGHRPSHA